jgi:transglutaminase-like putative cysteine protease
VGWLDFDPTNNLLAGERHIQVAVGRDYHDVPPTRGVFKGNASSELSVTVRVRQSEESPEALPDEEHAPAYVSTQQELQDQYSKTLLMMMQQQQ